MKTAKYILILTVLLLGCAKDKAATGCKTCTTTITETGHPNKVATQTMCNGEWQEVDGKRTSVKTNEGIYVVYIISTTVCK